MFLNPRKYFNHNKPTQRGRSLSRFSRWLGVPQDEAPRAGEVETHVLIQHQGLDTQLVAACNGLSAEIVVIDHELTNVTSELAHENRGLRSLRDRVAGMTELGHRLRNGLKLVVVVIFIGDVILLRPAFGWASPAGDLAWGPLKLGRDLGALATSGVLLILATISARALRTATARRKDKIAGNEPVALHADVRPEHTSVDLDNTAPLVTMPGSVDRQVHARPSVYSDIPRAVGALIALVTFGAGLVLCRVCGQLRQHSEALVAAAQPNTATLGLLQTSSAPATTSLTTFILLSVALFIAATAVAFFAFAPLSAALHAQERLIKPLRTKEKKIRAKREKTAANLLTMQHRRIELAETTALRVRLSKLQHAPSSVEKPLIEQDAPSIPGVPEIRGIYTSADDASKAVAPGGDLPLTPKDAGSLKDTDATNGPVIDLDQVRRENDEKNDETHHDEAEAM